jgi:hypothetical protein
MRNRVVSFATCPMKITTCCVIFIIETMAAAALPVFAAALS